MLCNAAGHAIHVDDEAAILIGRDPTAGAPNACAPGSTSSRCCSTRAAHPLDPERFPVRLAATSGQPVHDVIVVLPASTASPPAGCRSPPSPAHRRQRAAVGDRRRAHRSHRRLELGAAGRDVCRRAGRSRRARVSPGAPARRLPAREARLRHPGAGHRPLQERPRLARSRRDRAARMAGGRPPAARPARRRLRGAHRRGRFSAAAGRHLELDRRGPRRGAHQSRVRPPLGDRRARDLPHAQHRHRDLPLRRRRRRRAGAQRRQGHAPRPGGRRQHAGSSSTRASTPRPASARSSRAPCTGRSSSTTSSSTTSRRSTATAAASSVSRRCCAGRHPERGIVPPNQFIPLAEETGLMLPIGAWVLEAACRQAILWNPGIDRLGRRLRMAVNISAAAVRAAGHRRTRCARRCATPGSAPHLLELEITETTAMRDARAHDRTCSSGLRRSSACASRSTTSAPATRRCQPPRAAADRHGQDRPLLRARPATSAPSTRWSRRRSSPWATASG